MRALDKDMERLQDFPQSMKLPKHGTATAVFGRPRPPPPSTHTKNETKKEWNYERREEEYVMSAGQMKLTGFVENVDARRQR